MDNRIQQTSLVLFNSDEKICKTGSDSFNGEKEIRFARSILSRKEKEFIINKKEGYDVVGEMAWNYPII